MWDTDVPGLLLRVSETAKSFTLVYRMPDGSKARNGAPKLGPQRKMSLGRYPVVSLKEARERAREAMELVEQGEDPREERTERLGNTFETVFPEFVRQRLGHLSTARMLERKLRNHVLPRLASTPVADITRRDCHDVLDAVDTDANTIEVRKVMRIFFKWAVNRDLIAANPMLELERPELTNYQSKSGHAMTDEQLRELWAVLSDLNDYRVADQLKLIALTGARKGEWGRARWDEVDSEEKTLLVSQERQKSRRDVLLPLSDDAWGLVSALPSRGESSYLFPGRGAGLYLGSKQLAPVQQQLSFAWSPKDLRTTCRTRLSRIGVPYIIAEMCISHSVKKGLHATYDKHEFLNERRDAFDRYAEHLSEVING